MVLLFALQITLLAVAILIAVRLWRVSRLDGILCLVIPFYVLVPMYKHWEDPDHDIRFHVLALFLLVVGTIGMEFLVAHEMLVETQSAQTAARAPAQAGADGVLAADGSSARRGEPAAATASTGAAVSHETDASAHAPRQAVAEATFQRGTFERSSLGLAIDLPRHFHALAAGDARRIESSLNLPPDAHEIAWVLHESVALDSPSTWHVQVRWLSDGWVSTTGALDAVRLLQDAQQGKGATRLAGSGGALIGYAVAPSLTGAVADWVEERLPVGASTSVLDCHALRLGRHGVVEFSVTSAAPGAQELCGASVRLLARNTRFEAGADYSPAASDAARAPYTLAGLISGAP